MAKIFRTIFLATIFITFLGGTASALSETNDIKLNDNGVTKNYISDAATIGEFLEEQEIVLEENDTITPSLDEKILPNYVTEITINRAIDVKVYIDGKPEIYNIPVGTNAGEVIFPLENKNNCKYNADVKRIDVLYDGQEIHLETVMKDTFTTVEVIPFEVVYEEDNTITMGEEQIVQAGQFGEKTIVAEVELTQGVETEEKIVSETITKEPVTQIVKKGTLEAPKPEAIVAEGVVDVGTLNYSAQYTMEATAYTAGPESTGKSPGDPGYGITASGMQAQKGVVAVDTDVIPLGTELYIEGYGYAIAGDTGSGINGNEIDLFYETVDEALTFGRRDVVVYVLE